MGFQLEDQIVFGPIEGVGPEANAFLLELRGELFRRGLEGVDAGVGDGRGIVPLEERAELLGAEMFLPAVAEPLGMGVAEGGLGGFEFGERGGDGLALAEAAAHEGIDEAALRAEAEFFGDLDGFVDDGVVGNAIEPESLVETEAEENLQRDFLDAALGLARDEPVERGLPAALASCQ